MIILEEIDFVWEEKDITSVQAMWKNGTGLKEVSEKVKRRPEEVFLLLMHLCLEGKIKVRKGFVWGS